MPDPWIITGAGILALGAGMLTLHWGSRLPRSIKSMLLVIDASIAVMGAVMTVGTVYGIGF